MPSEITKAEAQPPDAPAALYFGDVMHARLKPRGHRFSYRVMSLLIDLDRLDEADRQSPLFAVNRAALYSFNEADHGERDGSSCCNSFISDSLQLWMLADRLGFQDEAAFLDYFVAELQPIQNWVEAV